MRPKLDQVTLCCIDTDHPAAGLRAVRLSQAQCDFAHTIFVTTSEFVRANAALHPAIEFFSIAQIDYIGYAFYLTKKLLELFSTTHVMINEWDGYVLDGQRWSDEFLQYDYIGAVWIEQPPPYRVGNGGFSLRSRRLLQVLARPSVVSSAPDDLFLGIELRPMLEQEGIKFADEATASRFSFELIEPKQPTFGFHGVFNLCRVVPPSDLQLILDMLTPRNLAHKHMAHVIKGYATRGMWPQALQVLKKMESMLDDKTVLKTLSEIADYDIEKANAARQVIYAMGFRDEDAANSLFRSGQTQ
jgi:hypothetical protein